MASTSHGLTVSQILRTKSKTEEDEPSHKKSREDWRKAKELEEARKAGTAPAAVDETGKDINPHIPQYISSAPWYYGTSGPTLKHQRPQNENQIKYSHLDEWYKRGVDTTSVATKYRRGACENCGAVTHKRKDCMERPRKIGAKYSSSNISADEHIQKDLSLDYDGKRDRWSGYNPIEHTAVIEEFQKVEEAKRLLKAEKLDANEPSDEDDEDKYVDEVDMPGTKVDSKQRITVRNLRIREDTAKYLKNLDPESAYYDPKTRSMRENPTPHLGDQNAGENFVKFTGDTTKHAKAQLFAWDAYEKGVDVHVLAEPTKLELLQKEYEKKKDQFKSKVQDDILDKYGGEEYLEAPPKSLLLAQTEQYVEYSRSGKIIKGEEKPVIRSKYEEDVLINNHTTVWGSYWNSGRWGYKCCHSFIKNSYCLGLEDKKVEPIQITEEEPVCKHKKKAKKKKSDSLKEALEQEESNQKTADKLLEMDERKRPYNSMYNVKKPTDDEMEAYYLKRKREEDPMSAFL